MAKKISGRCGLIKEKGLLHCKAGRALLQLRCGLIKEKGLLH